MTINQKKKNSD